MAQLAVIVMCPSERPPPLPCAVWRPRPQNHQRHKSRGAYEKDGISGTRGLDAEVTILR